MTRCFNHIDGKYLNSNGAKIYYETIGSKSKPVLVMLHGGFGNIEDLNPISKYLSKDFNIIGIDSTGHGKSTLGNKDLTYKKLQDDISKVLNHLEIKNFSISLHKNENKIVSFRGTNYSTPFLDDDVDFVGDDLSFISVK